MSNIRLMTKDKVKKLVERCPYLLPRNVWTGQVPKNYDYDYIVGVELPKGWIELFLQMCEDIRQPLIDNDYINEFRFSQIKEKYNTMRCYHFGAPEIVSQIISKYEYMAKYVCTQCGKPAKYESSGYFLSFCEDCWKGNNRAYSGCEIEFKPYYTVARFENGGSIKENISFENEWNRYIGKLENERIKTERST